MDKRYLGLNPRKYIIERADGKDPGEGFFISYGDPYAPEALEAYANICRDEYPLLADDLERIVKHLRAS